MDTHLSWKDHVRELTKTLRPLVGILSRLRKRVPENVKKLIYYSMIHSRLTYMVEVWGAAATSNLKTIQILQNRALCSVFDIEYMTPRQTIYGNMVGKILPVRGLYQKGIIQFVYKNLNSSLTSNIVFQTASHRYGTRNRYDLVTSHSETNYGLSRPTVVGPGLYNSLPVEVRQSQSYAHFKQGLHCFLSSAEKLATFLTY